MEDHPPEAGDEKSIAGLIDPENQARILLSTHDSDLIAEALDASPEVVPQLVELMKQSHHLL